MKIGIVLYPTFGGSGVVATELGMALAEKGHEVHFITYDHPARLSELGENMYYHEVSVSDYPLFHYKPYELVLTSKLVDVAKHYGLDILHVHYAIPHASAAFMAQKILAKEDIHIPYITTLHGTDITLLGRDPSFEPVITFAINESNAVTAVSQSLKDDTHRLFKIEHEIDVIPNFICPDRHVRKENTQLIKSYAPNGERIVIHISNFRKVKRVQDVMAVFDRIRKEVPAKMIFVGDGPERYNIERMCRNLGADADTYFLGKVKGVEDVLSLADLFLLTSETESFGLAALEAMITKVPVISSNTGGLPEVNKDEYSGFLSDVGDVEDMAANALKILRDDATLAKFKQQAYQRALDFDIDRILPQYEALYNDVIRRARVE